MRRLLWLTLAISSGYASERVFSIHDDVLAFPQYEIIFSKQYISEAQARRKLSKAHQKAETSANHRSPGDISDYQQAMDEADQESHLDDQGRDYERLVLDGRPYLCSIPRTDDGKEEEGEEEEEKTDSSSKTDREKDLVTAANRGWELLQDLEGKCMFFVSGWWSYSFCYNSQIKQFHQLPPGSGAPIYPPQEDPSTPSYVLGRFGDKKPVHQDDGAKARVNTELQTKGETRYLVQKLGGGTTCDLTGKDRRVEVQFHCHPQSTDRIGWIKEVATCAYLMIIYTPRLCNDVAFLPPRENRAHSIICRDILQPEEVAEWLRRKAAALERTQVDHSRQEPLLAGGIEVGAMKQVGREGRRIQKGKVVSIPDEVAETVAMQKGGKLQKLSKEDLKKLNLNPDTVDAFRKEIQDLAGNKDWKVEKIDDDQGVTQLRGIVAGDDEEHEGNDSAGGRDEQDREGSEEAYKENP